MTDDAVAEREISVQDGPQPVSRKPPWPIVLIAVFQFVKAGYLLYLSVIFWNAYSAWVAAGRPETPFLKSFLDNPFIVLFPVLAIGFVVLGFGLFQLRRWARQWLLWNTVICWADGGFSFSGLFFGDTVVIRHWHMHTVICVFLLDLFVFCCLAFYPDITKTVSDSD